MANIFDKEVEIKTLKVDGKIIRYNKETYPQLKYTCFVINCPKYLHKALRSRYGSIYGVDFCNDNHLTIENENGIVEIYNDICEQSIEISLVEYRAKALCKIHQGQGLINGFRNSYM